MSAQTKIGVVGCGTISGIYLRNIARFDNLKVVACADLDLERARDRAIRYGVPKFCSVADLLADPEVEIVLNLTIPAAHAQITEAALRAGKAVYNEKPLSARREEGQFLLDLAGELGLMIGAAPDTFLGGGLQTCRKLIDEGAIGIPVAATAFMLGHGPEAFHPDPDFYYQPGGGPLFDFGPYYLTALAAILGPVVSVVSSAKASFAERTITSQPRHGEIITVRTPTHIAGVLDFASGVIATLVTSFDVWAAEVPRLEIYGSEGTLNLPDPNTFGGPVRIRRAGEDKWSDVPLSFGYTVNSRGLGLSDMASALQSGREPRASGALAYHVLDIMHSILEASEQGMRIEIRSGVPRPEAMMGGLVDPRLSDPDWVIDPVPGTTGLSVDSKIKTLLDNSKALAVLEEHLPGFYVQHSGSYAQNLQLVELFDIEPDTFTLDMMEILSRDLSSIDL